jgi:hypothetical protein
MPVTKKTLKSVKNRKNAPKKLKRLDHFVGNERGVYPRYEIEYPTKESIRSALILRALLRNYKGDIVRKRWGIVLRSRFDDYSTVLFSLERLYTHDNFERIPTGVYRVYVRGGNPGERKLNSLEKVVDYIWKNRERIVFNDVSFANRGE